MIDSYLIRVDCKPLKALTSPIHKITWQDRMIARLIDLGYGFPKTLPLDDFMDEIDSATYEPTEEAKARLEQYTRGEQDVEKYKKYFIK